MQPGSGQAGVVHDGVAGPGVTVGEGQPVAGQRLVGQGDVGRITPRHWPWGRAAAPSSCHHVDGVGEHRQVRHRSAPDTYWLLPPARLVISSQSFRLGHLVPVR